MYSVKIENKINSIDSIDNTRYFNDLEGLKRYLLTFLNPVKEHSWLEGRAAVQDTEYNNRFINTYFNNTIKYFKNGGVCESGIIVNGTNCNSKENFEYFITVLKYSDNTIIS